MTMTMVEEVKHPSDLKPMTPYIWNSNTTMCVWKNGTNNLIGALSAGDLFFLTSHVVKKRERLGDVGYYYATAIVTKDNQRDKTMIGSVFWNEVENGKLSTQNFCAVELKEDD